MCSSISLSETDLLGLIRQEGLMVVDSISIKNRRQIDQNREILECNLIGRHSSYGSAIFDSRHGLPLTDQVLDVTYANIPNCLLKVILFTGAPVPSDTEMPAASLRAVREFVSVMNEFGAGVYLVKLELTENGDRRFKLIARPNPEDEDDQDRLPPEKVVRACEFWDIYFYELDPERFKYWSGLTELDPGELGYCGVAYDESIHVAAEWDETGLFYVTRNMFKGRGYMDYIRPIWRRKAQNIQKLFPRYRIEYAEYDSIIRLQVLEKPLDWILNAPLGQKKLIGSRIHAEVNLLMDSLQHVVRDCKRGKCTRDPELLTI